MYDFSGLTYRLWASSGLMLLITFILLLLEKPWVRGFKTKSILSTLFLVAFCIVWFSMDVYHVCAPDVSSYTGEFVEVYRTSRVSPPLPFTSKYAFWNGEGKKQVYYIDSFSKKDIFPEGGIEPGKKYTVYFEEATNIIVKIEEVE